MLLPGKSGPRAFRIFRRDKLYRLAYITLGGSIGSQGLSTEFDVTESAKKISTLAKEYLHDPSAHTDQANAAFAVELRKVFEDASKGEAVAAKLLQANWNVDSLPYTNVVRSSITKEITAIEFVPANLDFSAKKSSAYFPVSAAIEREQKALAAIGMAGGGDFFSRLSWR